MLHSVRDRTQNIHNMTCNADYVDDLVTSQPHSWGLHVWRLNTALEYQHWNCLLIAWTWLYVLILTRALLLDGAWNCTEDHIQLCSTHIEYSHAISIVKRTHTCTYLCICNRWSVWIENLQPSGSLCCGDTLVKVSTGGYRGWLLVVGSENYTYPN